MAQTGRSLNRRILHLAIPNLLAAISVPLIGVADTAMVGHLPEVAFMGAVASASVIFDVLFWGAGFLRMGTTSIVSQHFGAGDRAACAAALYRALILAVLLAGGILLVRGPVADLGFDLLGGSTDVQKWGGRYFQVRALGVPLVLATYVLSGFFLGTANVFAPMWMTLVANLVNVGADYILIYGKWGAPALGVVGAAWAAVLGNAVAFAMGVTVVLVRYRDYLRLHQDPLFSWERISHLIHTNANLFGRTLCLLLAQFAMMAMVSRMGEASLAAHAVVWQVWAMASYGVDGFAHAAEILVGNLLGARDFVAARRVAGRILMWGVGIGACLSVSYGLGLRTIGGAFTEHADVIDAVAGLALVIAVIQPLNAAVFVFDGILIGANDVTYLFAAMAVAAFGVFAPCSLIFVYWLDWGLPGAWLAYDGLMVGRFCTLCLRYRGDTWLRTFACDETTSPQ